MSDEIKIPIVDALLYAASLRRLFVQVGVEKFPLGHPLRDLEKSLTPDLEKELADIRSARHG